MPTYLDPWDEAVPSGSSDISLGDDAIRQKARALRERLSTDHKFEADESSILTIGYHKQSTYIETASLPLPTTGLLSVGGQTFATANGGNDKVELATKDALGNVTYLTKSGKIPPKYFGDLSTIPDTAGQIPLANLSNVAGVVPVGGIIMYSGLIANIPTNWAFCNGSNSTPDLRDRMVICGKQDDAGSVKTNVTGTLTVSGGSATKTLSVSEMPAHTHSTPSANANGWASGNFIQGSNNTGSPPAPTTIVTDSTGGGTAFSLLNPYYALAFIMRTA